jgi:hypothetical protein
VQRHVIHYLAAEVPYANQTDDQYFLEVAENSFVDRPGSAIDRFRLKIPDVMDLCDVTLPGGLKEEEEKLPCQGESRESRRKGPA